ncbi:hypothetical protein V8E51_000117 [Hyaloscypha variabilis]
MSELGHRAHMIGIKPNLKGDPPSSQGSPGSGACARSTYRHEAAASSSGPKSLPHLDWVPQFHRHLCMPLQVTSLPLLASPSQHLHFSSTFGRALLSSGDVSVRS